MSADTPRLRRPGQPAQPWLARARTPRSRAWLAVAALALAVVPVRLLAGASPAAPFIDLGWGVFCAAAMVLGIGWNRERGRLAWVLFTVSVACGALSQATHGGPAGPGTWEAVHGAADAGAYVFGLIGMLVLLRRVGSGEPDAWIDAFAVGLTVALLLFEFLLEHSRTITGEAADRGTLYALAIAAIDAAVFAVLARFVIRPIASVSLSLLGAAICIALVVDASSYVLGDLAHAGYAAMWAFAYGAWAAGSLHPDMATLSQPSTRVRTAEQEFRSIFQAVGIHGAGAVVLMLAFGAHMARPEPERANGGLVVFVVVMALQLLLVGTRTIRLARRLLRDEVRRAAAESALRASEERFRRLAEVAPVGIFVTDAAGRSNFQNEAWAEVAGVSPAEGLGAGYERLIHPDDADASREAWARAMAAHDGLRLQQRMLRPDGGVRWVQLNAAPLRAADGSPGGYIGTVSDVTDLVEARTAAQEREAFVSGLIEQAPVGIAVYDPQGRAINANAVQRALRERLAPGEAAPDDVRTDALMVRLGQARAMLGAFAGRAGGDQRPVRIDMTPAGEAPGSAAAPTSSTADASSGPTAPAGAAGSSATSEGDPSDAVDGTWLRMTWFPLLDASGAVCAVVSFAEDVTPAARADAERRAMEARLQEVAKLEALGVLAGGIAHDFNNLLVAILGHASLARLQLPPTSSVQGDLASVETAARRAADLARQMLAYSGRGSFVVARVDVESLLREMGDLLSRSISKGATLGFDFAPGLPSVVADATQLRQLALNLIVNASEALDGRAGRITLRTGLVTLSPDDPDLVPGILPAPGTYVLLEVADTGHGMDRATLERIFTPFYSTKATGRGLGLAATLGIVRGHGGAVRVQSEPGVGTRFGILLRPAPPEMPDGAPSTAAAPGAERPVRAATPTVAGMRAVAAPTATPSAPTSAPTPDAPAVAGTPRDAARPRVAARPRRVLLVDDEATVRTLGRRVLERAGYEVADAPDGPEAIEAFEADPDGFDALLLDLTLPTLDGMAVLERIRRVRPTIPAVVCSGWAAEEVAERLQSTPGTVLVEKPYAPAAMVRAFETLLDGRGSGAVPWA